MHVHKLLILNKEKKKKRRDSNTGLKLYRVSEEFGPRAFGDEDEPSNQSGKAQPVLFECKFIRKSQYFYCRCCCVVLPKILLSFNPISSVNSLLITLDT